MAGKKSVKRWSIEEKAKALARLAQESAQQVADSIGVSVATIYTWKVAAGMNGSNSSNGAAARPGKKAKKAAKKAPNGQIRVTAGGLDAIEKQLESSLVSVRAMRVAFRTVFGGQ